MSGFDGLERTQNFGAGLQMEGARLREQRRQFDVNAFQQQMQLNQRQTESDAQIAAWEQSRQLDQYKLQMMQSVDQAKMSRLQTEQAEIGVATARLALEREKEKAGGRDAESRKTMEEIRKIRLSSMGANPEERLASGYVPDPNDPLGWRKPRDDAEMTRARDSYTSLKAALESGDYRARDRTSTELHRELGMLTNPVNRAMMTPDQRRAADERARILQSEWSQKYGGGGAAAPAGHGAAEPSTAPTPKAAAAKPGAPIESPFERGSLEDSVWQNDRWQTDPFWKGLADDVDESGRPVTRDIMAYTMASFGPALAWYKGWRGSIDALMFSAAEKDPEVLGFLLKASPTASGGDRSDEDILRILKSRFPERAGQIGETMRRIQRSIDWTLEREKQGGGR